MGGYCYHVLNRGNAQAEVFRKPGDYMAFLRLLAEAGERVPIRLLAYCLMPNHFHLVLWPREDEELSRYMQWLMTSHVRRHHRHYGTNGHIWQGRFKAFPIEQDEHLLAVLRYVERNPVRAKSLPIRKARRWPWSSASDQSPELIRPVLDPGPVPRGADWHDWLDQPQSEAELAALRDSLTRDRPYGSSAWQQQTARQLGLESTLRPRGRPRKTGTS